MNRRARAAAGERAGARVQEDDVEFHVALGRPPATRRWRNLAAHRTNAADLAAAPARPGRRTAHASDHEHATPILTAVRGTTALGSAGRDGRDANTVEGYRSEHARKWGGQRGITATQSARDGAAKSAERGQPNSA